MGDYEVHFSPAVEADFRALRHQVSERAGPAIAQRLVDQIISYCERFSVVPLRGIDRSDIAPGLRVVGWRRRATIAFRVDLPSKVVTIIAVLYRGRDVDGALARRRP